MLLQFPEHMNFGNSINSDMKDIKDSVTLKLEFACLMNYFFLENSSSSALLPIGDD
jgi:hypothetical protein